MESKARKNISIVLVEPKGAGNVGSVARVMKNTGFRNLVLVNSVQYKNDEGFSMACSASDVLLKAKEVKTLKQAVKDSHFIVGTTRRKGGARFPVFTMDEALPKILSVSKKNTVSILFGREDRGLENEETLFCDILFEIPAHRDMMSLNLSHAVFAVCHALFKTEASCVVELTLKSASREEVEAMHEHIERVLEKLGYADEIKKGYLMPILLRNLRKIFGRTVLVEKEVNMLRGILTRIEEKI
ncbi:MAG TPA: RNA methyltransferase [Thermodesulfobacteriota bacterium]|nr:RNA methyltransferase [Thermodesulfobacteriota bacterium]